MSLYAIPPAATPSLAIDGDSQRFPLRRVFCIGRNYPWPGADPLASQAPPSYFMKPADAVVAASGHIPYPPMTQDFCHEIELIVAVGRDAQAVSANEALDCVWGYGVGVDLTRRDLQAAAKQSGQSWEGAKAFDASATATPLIRVDQSGHPQGALWLAVNGIERQRANLSDQLWSVPALISFLSHSITLKAGDLIFTGTPFGVGALSPGDRVTGGIDGLNTFSFDITAPATSARYSYAVPHPQRGITESSTPTAQPQQ